MFPIGSLDELLISIGPLFQVQCHFLAYCTVEKAHWRAAEKCRNFCAVLEYVLPVHRIYQSVDKVIFKNNIRECNSVILKNMFHQYVFTLTAGKIVKIQ